MVNVLPLAEIDPISGNSPETLDYVRCDCCSEAAYHDGWAGNPERAFYEVLGEGGLVVCGNCVPELGD